MRKKSDQKPQFAAELRRVRDLLVTAASLGSQTDAVMTRHAVEACRFASQWVTSTTVTDQTHIVRRARALEDAAYSCPNKSRLVMALASYARALDLYAHCDYKAAQLNVNAAETLISTP